jgi:hypothetical protein
MVELGARLILAGLALLVSGMAGIPPFEIAWKAALAVAAYSAFGYQLELRNLKNPGISGFFAIADAFVLAMLIGASGGLHNYGFFVLAPCAYAAARHGSLSSAMAPLAAGGLLVADAIFNKPSMGMPVLAQAAGVLGVGLLLNQKRIVMTVTRELVRETPAAALVDGPEPGAFLELRENYRKVRTLYRDLLHKSRREHLTVELVEAKLGEGGTFHKRLTLKLQDLVGADTLALYTLAQCDDMMVVRAVAGKHPEALKDSSHRVNLGLAPGQVKHGLESALNSLLTDESKSRMANVLLIDRGRVVGMVALGHEHATDLEQIREEMENLAPMAAAMIREEAKRESIERRLKETELLYDIAVTSTGAEHPRNIAARVVRELGNVIEADHLEVFFFEGQDVVSVAHAGVSVTLLDAMTFTSGPGLQGWLRMGAPEVVIHDTAMDERLPYQEAIKRRMNSFCVFPLQYDDRPYGFITAGSHRAAGIDVADAATLRSIAAEMSQALGRLHEPSSGGSGLMTPREFQELVEISKSGWLVYLEPLKRDLLIDAFGRPAVEHALRKFARRMRSRLPIGGALCRRSEGDYVAFIPVGQEEFVRSWANDAAATASMIGLRTPDGSARIPLALRAKVAPLVQNVPSAS